MGDARRGGDVRDNALGGALVVSADLDEQVFARADVTAKVIGATPRVAGAAGAVEVADGWGTILLTGFAVDPLEDGPGHDGGPADLATGVRAADDGRHVGGGRRLDNREQRECQCGGGQSSHHALLLLRIPSQGSSV
jgi:hypothetical protein